MLINPYLIPGLKREPKTYKAEHVAALISLAEEYYNLPEGTLYKKRKGSGFPFRIWDKISLSDIRKSIILIVKSKTDLTMRGFSEIMKMDPTSFEKSYRIGVSYIEQQDKTFMSYYNVIRELAQSVLVATYKKTA